MLNSRLLGLIWPTHPTQWRDVPARLLPVGVQMVRLTTAAVVAYLLTLPLAKGGPIDLTGPLTAMLVVQASAVGTFRMGLVRVGAVLSGVLIATLLSNWIGLTWWSLGAAIASAFLLARILRLREQLIEAPISAMLILGVTNHGVAAEVRVLNTFVGAGVGMAMGMLFPTALAAASVIGALKRMAASMAKPLDEAAEVMRERPPSRSEAQEWLDLARSTAGELAEVNGSVASLRERRRWNPRALGTTNTIPVLDSALDAYDRCLLSVRAVFTAIVAELPDGETEDRFGEELRQIFAVVLDQTADCLRAFGELIAAEADGREDQAEAALQESLEYAGETRAMLTELMLLDSGQRQSWMLRSSVIVALEHVLAELRLENRERARSARRKQRLPAVVEGVLPHPERPYPRAVDMVLDRRRMLRHRSRER